jgi:hypothetical protein
MKSEVHEPPAALVRVTTRSRRWSQRSLDGAWATYGVGTVGFCTALLSGMALFPQAHPSPALGFAILGCMASVAVSPFLTLAGLIIGRGRVATASVDVERGALRITSAGEHVELGPKELAQGAVRPGGILEVQDTSGRQHTIETSPERAAALLDALDLEPEQRRFSFQWQLRNQRVFAFIGTLLLSGFLLLLPIELLEGSSALPAYSCLFVTAPWLLAELVSRWASRRELSVGTDGVESKSRLGRKLLRFGDIAEVRDTGAFLEVSTTDGVVHHLLADPDDPAVAEAMRQRLREAWAVARARAGKGTIASAMLERAGQSMGEWRASVAKILTAATGFRGAAIGSSELSEVMDDVTAPPEQRLAAAIALGSDPASRPRVRVAAEASVSPRMRVALEQLAAGEADDEILEAALVEQQRRS